MGSGAGVMRAACVAFCAAMLAACGDVKLTRPVLSVRLSQPLMDYGVVALGAQATQTLTVTNTGRAEVAVSELSAPAPFSVLGMPEGGFTLGSGESRTFEVGFQPPVEGMFNAGLTVTSDDDVGGQSVPLMGRGVKAFVLVKPSDTLDFGIVSLGNAKVLTVDLTNPSELAAKALVRIDGSDAENFSSADLKAGEPLTVESRSTKTLNVAFHPNHLGSSEAWLHVTPCPGCQEVNVKLIGGGAASCIGVTPWAVEFGTVDLGDHAEQVLDVTNLGNGAVNLTEVFLTSTTPKDFTFQGFKAGDRVSLAPGAHMQLKVLLDPKNKGALQGSLRLHAGSAAEQCYAEVQLHAVGGAGCLDVTPRSLNFGSVATGMNKTMTVSVANTACGKDVTLAGVAVTGDPSFSALAAQPGSIVLHQGEVTDIKVTFSPATKGNFTGKLALSASDAAGMPLDNPPAPVPLEGYGRELPPCDFSATPPRLDFGATTVNSMTLLAVDVTNTGKDACYFSDVKLSTNSSPAFHISGGNIAGFNLNPGESRAIRVKFIPPSIGTFAATLQYYVSDPANPLRQHAITGKAVSGCLSIQPTDLDFGTVFVGCTPPTLSFVATNSCPAAVTLNSLTRGAGTSTEFTITRSPALPATVQPGQSVTFSVTYIPTNDGIDSMPLYLDDGANKRLVSAHGEGVTHPTKTDHFDQADQAKVDVLLVIDNSGSMMEEQDAISKNFDDFIKFAQAQGIDYHIGVTTTGIDPSPGGWSTCPGGVDGGEAGRLFPVDNSSPRILTPTTPSVGNAFATDVKVGVCHWLEQGIEAAYRALSPPLVDHADDPRSNAPNDGNLGFLRDDAKLAVVFVSDEDDQSPQSTNFYLSFFQALKKNDPSMLSMSAIVGPADLSTCPTASSSGSRYMELAQKTGGYIESICTSRWDQTLQSVGLNAFGPKNVFPLSTKPGDPAGISVKVNGVVQGHWHYDGGTNSVVFDPGTAPAAGSSVDVTYPLGCP